MGFSPGEDAYIQPRNAWRGGGVSLPGCDRGSETTVKRSIRLICSGALDDASVEVLAERLGIGSRQLSRLFTSYLGASPTQVARTARVQRAKRLLHETDLPMSEIAFRSGFRSLRRFNTVFAEVYQDTTRCDALAPTPRTMPEDVAGA